jgi:FkbM family methyltransferase
MQVSELLLKRRIAAQLPPRIQDSDTNQNASQAGDSSQAADSREFRTVDLSDLPAIADDEGFLQEAYRRILGRECDVSGLVSCLELLRRHVPRPVVLLQLINSKEGRQRGFTFTGIQELGPSTRGRSSRFSISNIAGRLGAVFTDIIRGNVFSRVDSIDHKLEFLLRNFAARTDALAGRTDESFVLLSTKLDAYVSSLSEDNRRNREELVQQHKHLSELQRAFENTGEQLVSQSLSISRLTTDLEEAAQDVLHIRDTIRSASNALAEQGRALERIRSGASENADATRAALADGFGRIRPPVVSVGSEVIATEVAGMIVGVPGTEWRMAAYHAFRGAMEPGLIKHFSSLIQPGAVVVDVGANVGIYTLLAAKLLAGNGEIYSFEPTPRTYDILRDNVQVNGFLEAGIVHLYKLAVTDRAGHAKLSIFDRDCGHNTLFGDGHADNEIEVSTNSLDEILKTQHQVDVVKIDAEGAEPLILRGLKQVIERNPGIRILMEFAPVHLKRAGTSPDELLDDIASTGFVVRRIDDVSGQLWNVTRKELNETFSSNLHLAFPSRTEAGQ